MVPFMILGKIGAFFNSLRQNFVPQKNIKQSFDNKVFYRFTYKLDYSPHGYNLPLEYTKLAAECSRGRNATHKFLDEKPIWICKPVAQSQGRGIFLFRVRMLTIVG